MLILFELLYCVDIGNTGNILEDAISIVRVKDRGRLYIHMHPM